MKINQKGLDLIKHFEGLKLSVYDDGTGTLTIGTGHTKGVFEGMIITQEEADELLAEDIKYFEQAVNELVTVPLTSNQFSALVSFTFNLGRDSLRTSTLLRDLNEGRYEEVAEQLLRWNKIGKVVEPGLTRRRQAERELFLTEDEGIQPTSLKKYRERFVAVMKTHYDLVADLITEIERLENS